MASSPAYAGTMTAAQTRRHLRPQTIRHSLNADFQRFLPATLPSTAISNPYETRRPLRLDGITLLGDDSRNAHP
jgi:hypothetical protein